MLDPVERKAWYRVYRRSGLKYRHVPKEEVDAWARSMSLIAEQFIDNDDRDPVDPEPVT